MDAIAKYINNNKKKKKKKKKKIINTSPTRVCDTTPIS